MQRSQGIMTIKSATNMLKEFARSNDIVVVATIVTLDKKTREIHVETLNSENPDPPQSKQML